MQNQDPDDDDLAAIAHAALERIEKYGSRPSPKAYEVWFGYFTGANVDLIADIDELIKQRRSVTDLDLEHLYARHLESKTDVEIRETTSEIKSAVEEVLSVVGSAGANLQSLGDSLQSATGQLQDATDSESLRGLVLILTGSTRKVIGRSRELEVQLKRSNLYIAELRNRLLSLQKDAETDLLTSIGNRRFFESALRRLASESLASGQRLSMCMIDIDHFKQFNDTHGHQLGDQVLRLVGRTLREGLKGRDVTARYGGEEFAILMPNTRLRDANSVAEQLRQLVGSRILRNRMTGDSIGSVTLSIGVSQYRPREPIAAFVARADAALYLAKSSGRNRVCFETMLTDGA